MKYHVLRFDVWLCLLISVLLAFGAGKLAEGLLQQKYEEHKQEHKVDVGQIGGKADESVFRAQNVDDLLANDTFTIVSKGIKYMNEGAGYYKNFYIYAVTLPSGQRVAARVNQENVTHTGDSIYSGDSILPVGRIIKEDLTKEEYFMDQIEYSKPLDRTDFYIDMVGEAEIQSEESFIEAPIILIQLLVIAIVFPITHALGSKIGIFPYFFNPRI